MNIFKNKKNDILMYPLNQQQIEIGIKISNDRTSKLCFKNKYAEI